MKIDNLIADRKYGKALFEIAKENKMIDEVYQELLDLRAVFVEVPDLGLILSDDRLESFEKIDILHELDKDFSDVVSKFIYVIYDYGRMKEMPGIIDEFENLYYENKGILIVDVVSAVELTDEESKDLEERTVKLYEVNQVILRKKVDPSILGGLIIQANHRVIDNSVKKQLDDMHRELLK
ncbi:ATP synthase F1 subunit delta [Vagococcus humatus]|uniref:ATP synthase subunit delta n=1 Tax=Vagococcus humatus TaxID=1889241 RepID=A0A3R9YE19_9ENTE|nr:ATP synthase F1 subunit delta [Vagococcus humatus]RST90153.1 F0F1 ATP synthase subunit delta [Vagococcus humatus]